MPLLSKEFLALWDNPGEHVQMVFSRLDSECHLAVVVSAPDCPVLKIEIEPMKVGEA